MADDRHGGGGLADRHDVEYRVEYRVEAREADAETFEAARAYNERVAGIVVAAVVNDADELLFVHHEGYDGWVLPGGNAEPGEDFRAAAAREVREEAGVGATMTRPLLVVDFVNRHEGRWTSCPLVLFEGVADDDRTADDPGLAYEPITDVRWTDTVPDGTGGDETVQRVLSVVEERFDWLDGATE